MTAMYAAPDDVLDVARAWVVAAQARDVEHVRRHSCAPAPSALHTFGSGPANLTLDELVEHLQSYPPIAIDDVELAGWTGGDVAWVAGTGRVHLSATDTLDVRVTVVLVHEDSWQVAHCHLSEAVQHDV